MLFYSLGLDDPYPYQTQLKKMQMLLNKQEGSHDEEVEKILGNGEVALYSVPTAIFCFLRAYAPIPEIEVCRPFLKNYSVFSLQHLIWKENKGYEFISIYMFALQSNFRNKLTNFHETCI
jgi:hypothetical protein